MKNNSSNSSSLLLVTFYCCIVLPITIQLVQVVKKVALIRYQYTFLILTLNIEQQMPTDEI